MFKIKSITKKENVMTINLNTVNLNKKRVMNKIELLETMIDIYSDRDQVRVRDLECDLFEANMELLEIMTNEGPTLQEA